MPEQPVGERHTDPYDLPGGTAASLLLPDAPAA